MTRKRGHKNTYNTRLSYRGTGKKPNNKETKNNKHNKYYKPHKPSSLFTKFYNY